MSHVLTAALFVAAILFTTPVAAQQEAAQSHRLKWPTVVYLSAATADWSSHHYCMAQSQWCVEGNPMYSWAGERSPWTTVVGGSVNGFTVWAVNKWVAPRHPRLAVFGLIAGAVIQGWAAYTNVQLGHHLGRCNGVRIPQACH
jgi:hypothetical protein